MFPKYATIKAVMNPYSEKSESFWVTGSAFAEEGLWNSAAHTLYYAVFQAIYGFAETNGLVADGEQGSKHSLVRKIVEKYLGNKQLRILKRLYSARIKADYHVEDAEERDVQPHIDGANAIRQYFISFEPKVSIRI